MPHNDLGTKRFGTNDGFGDSPTALTSPEPTARLAPLELPALANDARDALSGVDTTANAPPEGERWSSWDGARHGPSPRPDWVIADLGAVDQDLGILKSGKEADVHVVRHWGSRQ